MQRQVIQRILGLLLAAFSITMLVPVVFSFIYEGESVLPFIASTLITFAAAVALWYPVRDFRDDLRLREGFLIVVLFWTVLGIFGALPFLFSPALSLGLTDSVFESISGLTTTGATVIPNLDTLPKSILFYAQSLQWLGGMESSCWRWHPATAGRRGMQLYRAETPGPVKDNRLTPRIKETAKALWYIYLSLTVACAFSFCCRPQMSVFDAIAHSFSTVAIAGSPPTMRASLFRQWGDRGINHPVHYIGRAPTSACTSSPGSRPALPLPAGCGVSHHMVVLVAVTVIALITLRISEVYPGLGETFGKAVFHAVSIGTTTGFTTSQFHLWPGFLPWLLVLASFIGGCAGSTGGGIKVIRVLLLVKQGLRELLRLVHPSAKIAVKIGEKAVDSRVIEAVWGFFSAYIAVFVFMLLLLMATGLDEVTAFSAVTATLNNLGPGLGDVALNYTGINGFSKWVLCLGMLLGRLEIFTLLVVLTPAFWRR